MTISIEEQEMRDEEITESEALRYLMAWQSDGTLVEVVMRFSQGLTQTHSGRLTVEPEGQVVIAHVAGKNDYLTTVLDVSSFDSIRLLESLGAITFSERERIGPFKSVTIARLSQQQAVDPQVLFRLERKQGTTS